jgi:hypothetical protein
MLLWRTKGWNKTESHLVPINRFLNPFHATPEIRCLESLVLVWRKFLLSFLSSYSGKFAMHNEDWLIDWLIDSFIHSFTKNLAWNDKILWLEILKGRPRSRWKDVRMDPRVQSCVERTHLHKTGRELRITLRKLLNVWWLARPSLSYKSTHSNTVERGSSFENSLPGDHEVGKVANWTHCCSHLQY